MSDTDAIRAGAVVPQTKGEPYVALLANQLQVFVTGIDGICLSIAPADWRKLNAAVEAKIAEAAKAEVSQSIAADMAASPVVANSPVLHNYLACEGIEVGQ